MFNIKAHAENINKTINIHFHIMLKILSVVLPLFFFFEIKDILFPVNSFAKLFFFESMQILGYTILAFLSFRLLVLGKGEVFNLTSWNFLKNLFLFTGKILLILALLKFAPMLGSNVVIIPFSMTALIITQIVETIIYVFCVFLLIRFSFVFPAQAIGKNMSLAQSFRLTQNKESIMILSSLKTAYPYMLVLIVGLQGIPMVFGSILAGSENEMVNALTKKILYAPLSLFLKPYIFLIFITTLALSFQTAQSERKIEG